MQELIDKVRPLLTSEFTVPEKDHIGFTVAMDFRSMRKQLYQLLCLARKTKNADIESIHTH